ncbi:hypothetical protein PhCBS80983_g03916 [Powellomyces hirtus]|uniref:Amino acid permease/ SLC12A domain-containing protein n=1 Tax=Powellomyces hirtus TaxID=109895 RepID=A0A507E0F5_9FUNG|nr:hypothetical protein PhCBS80983_g03916 [Powellomyces hirtus]
MPSDRRLSDQQRGRYADVNSDFDDHDFDLDAHADFDDGEFGDDLDLEESINALLPEADRTGGPSRPRRQSSATFELDNQFLIPLSSTLSRSELALPADLTFLSALGLIIGMSIGSGIFASPGPVFAHAGSVGAALMVWLGAGLLAISGGMCYAELGTAFPSSGGEHPYLMAAFGDLPAFLFSWTGATVTRPGSVSIISIITAEYAVRLMYYNHPDPSSEALPSWLVKFMAVITILALTALNSMSTRAGTLVQNIFTILKLASLVVIGLIGVVKLARGHVVGDPADGSENFNHSSLFQGSSTSPGDYALALYSALWAYDGWNNLNLVAGELKNPSKDLPRAVTLGPLIVIICYLLANVAYYAVLPADTIANSNTIAMHFGRRVFGHVGAIIIPLIVVGSTLGASNASIFSGARVAYVSARASHLPSFLGKIHPRYKTPFNALLTQSTLSVVFVLFGSFTSLVTFYSMIAWLFYLLAVLALLVLRRSQPHLDRPYRVYTPVAATFLASVVFLLASSALAAPVQALGALAFVTSGVPVYWVVVRKKLGWDGK